MPCWQLQCFDSGMRLKWACPIIFALLITQLECNWFLLRSVEWQDGSSLLYKVRWRFVYCNAKDCVMLFDCCELRRTINYVIPPKQNVRNPIIVKSWQFLKSVVYLSLKMANCFTRRSNYPKCVSRKDYVSFFPNSSEDKKVELAPQIPSNREQCRWDSQSKVFIKNMFC